MMALKDELLALEHEYWDGIKAKDAKVAAKLTGESVVYVGSTGVAQMTREEISSMAGSTDARVVDYGFDPGSVTVAPITDDVAAVAYRVTRTNEDKGKKEKIVTFDSTVWARRDGHWQAVMHTSMPAPS